MIESPSKIIKILTKISKNLIFRTVLNLYLCTLKKLAENGVI